MVGYLSLIFGCELVGELIADALSVPIPGPVLGMLLLFGILAFRREVPTALGATADGLLKAMSLLFVPAGAGVLVHFRLVGEALLPLGLALVASTIFTIGVTAVLMRWLSKGAADE